MKELLKECAEALESVNGLVVKSENVDCKFDDLIYRLDEQILKRELSIQDYFNIWEMAIEEIKEKSIELINIKETYNQLEQDILLNTDFKELYGVNNEKVRKNHIKSELKEFVDKKHDLEIRIDYLKRRTEFIKSLMQMQSILINCGVVDD